MGTGTQPPDLSVFFPQRAKDGLEGKAGQEGPYAGVVSIAQVGRWRHVSSGPNSFTL